MPELVDLPDRINIYPMHEPCFVLSTIINKRERKRERENRIDQPCEIFIEYPLLRDTRYTEYKIKNQFYHNTTCNTSLIYKAINIFLIL